MIKAIFFDVDGTIISYATKSIPQSTRDAIEQLRKQGILCVVATGRTLMELDDLPIRDMEFDGYIMLNGQLGFDHKKEMLFGVPIEENDFRTMVRMFNEKQIPLSFAEVDKLYINFIDDTVVKAQEMIGSPMLDIGEYTGNPVYMTAAFLGFDKEEWLKEQFPNCDLTRWHSFGFDIFAKTGGKVWGIQQFMEKMGIQQDEIMCIGDGENDKDMIRYAHIGVAMQEANANVQQAADFVTDTVDNDGILKALQHFNIL